MMHDRDALFTAEFPRAFEHAGAPSAKRRPRSANLNARPERFVRSIKEYCLERLILFAGKLVAHSVYNLELIN